MSIATGDLLTLIRLLEDRLEAADGVRVRERLAVDKDLLIGWRTLAHVLEHEVSTDDLRAAELVRPEQMAAFIEERLDPREAAGLEQTCWNHPALLREAVSVFRALHDDDSATLPDHAVTQRTFQRMDTIVSQQCSANAAPSRHGNNGASSARAAPPRPPTAQHTTRPARRDSSLPVLTRRTATETASTGRRRMVAGLIAMSIAALLLVVGWLFVSGRFDWRQPIPGPIVDEPPVPAPSAPRRPLDSSAGAGDSSRIVNSPPDGGSSRSPDSGPGSTAPDQPKRPEKSGGSGALLAGMTWDSPSGMVAARRRDQDRWSGILALTDQTSRAPGPLIVRTLPGSRIEGRGPAGAGLVLDADSEVRVSAGGTEGLVFDFEPRQGRVAVVDLNSGDQVRCQIGTRTWTVQSRAAKTSVGFTRRNRDGRTWDLLAWAGDVTVDTVSLSAGQLLRWDGEAFETPVALSEQSDWRRDSPSRPVLSPARIDRCNRSADLTTALLNVAKQGDAGQRIATIGLGFSLDPVTAVPAAAVSTNPQQRTAAIEWLLAAEKTSPVARQVWKGVKSALGPSGKPVQLRRWFEIMRNGRKPQAADLGRLVRGLGPRRPVFVRQCSIHFLRQITRLPLAEYHPDQPTRAAVMSVIQKVRRFVGNAHPRSRKGNARPRPGRDKARLRSRKIKDTRRRAR